MRSASALLFAANLVYATSYVATRVVLDDLPPAFLALVRLVVGAAILVPIARAIEAPAGPPARGDAWRIVWMGVVGFAGAFALSHWGLARSTATNAALLIIVEPLSIMALSPPLHGERLRKRMESAQKHLAEHPIWRVFFWRRGRYGVPSATPATHS